MAQRFSASHPAGGFHLRRSRPSREVFGSGSGPRQTPEAGTARTCAGVDAVRPAGRRRSLSPGPCHAPAIEGRCGGGDPHERAAIGIGSAQTRAIDVGKFKPLILGQNRTAANTDPPIANPGRTPPRVCACLGLRQGHRMNLGSLYADSYADSGVQFGPIDRLSLPSVDLRSATTGRFGIARKAHSIRFSRC